MEHWRKPSRHRLQLIIGLWVALVIYALVSQFSVVGIDPWQTLRVSNFARVMFADIGIMSFLSAGYIFLAHRSWLRIPVALLTLFLGSFVLLPYLAWHEWRSLNFKPKSPPKDS